jgi:hypothetical protein
MNISRLPNSPVALQGLEEVVRALQKGVVVLVDRHHNDRDRSLRHPLLLQMYRSEGGLD